MSIISCVVAFVRKLVDFVSFLIASYFYRSQKSCLPSIKEPILMESAVVVSEKIRRGKLKCVAVVRAYLKRIEDVNKDIVAVGKIREEAIKEAEEIDRKGDLELNGNEPEGGESVLSLPLLGIRFTCKETVGVVRMPFTAGLVSRIGCRAQEDAPVIKNLRSQGAICLGGEGAIISAAGGVVGVGTDIAGSL
ncbi:fatty-acid amide hydrolase 2-A-like protein, partial [Leptotrombidium deliense]